MRRLPTPTSRSAPPRAFAAPPPLSLRPFHHLCVTHYPHQSRTRPPPIYSAPRVIEARFCQSLSQFYLNKLRQPGHSSTLPTRSATGPGSFDTRDAVVDSDEPLPLTTLLSMPSGDSPRQVRDPATLPSALDGLADLAAALARDKRRVVFFLDYDGTLSPIVEDPDSAFIPERTREALSIVASRFTTAIVSGRSKEKVMSMVNLEQLIYAGSHGFDIEGPQGVISHRVASDWLPSLKDAWNDLNDLVPLFPGSSIEDNLLSISFHYRKVDPSRIQEAQRMVDETVQRHGLVRTVGKMVYEVRPLFDWHKGKAVEYLLDALQLMGPEVLPIYIGDDVTDEDAFKVLQGKGISVIVADSSSSRNTHADMRLNDPIEVQRFLMHFARDETLVPCLTESVPRPDVSVASE